MQLACGCKLMQGPDRKAPLERRIESGHAQPERALFGAQGGNPAGQGKNPVPIGCGHRPSDPIPFVGEEKGRAGAGTSEGCGHFCNCNVRVLFSLIPQPGTGVKVS
jgi:hypothetical protein